MKSETGSALATALTQAVAPAVAAHGADLEDVQVRRAGSRLLVRVLVDRDGGVTLDDVAEVSSSVAQALDDASVLGERSYVLDVGSPGVDRPLTLLRHWRRNVGRLVRVTAATGPGRTGRIVSAAGPDAAAAPDAVVLDIEGSRVELPGSTIRRAVVQVEFSDAGGDG